MHFEKPEELDPEYALNKEALFVGNAKVPWTHVVVGVKLAKGESCCVCKGREEVWKEKREVCKNMFGTRKSSQSVNVNDV